MRKKKEIKIGIKGEAEIAEEFVEVYHQAEKGRASKKQTERIYFADIETLTRTLSTRRIEILHALHKRGPLSVRALAQRVERDYKNVYDDVHLLKRAGFIDADSEGRVLVPWDRIAAEILLAA